MNVVISAWSDLTGDCPIRAVVANGNEAAIVYGSGAGIGELDLDYAAMRNLVKVTADALAEMDERAGREQERAC